MNIEIPTNTIATVYVPAKDAKEILEGGMPLSTVKNIKITVSEEGYVVLKTGSGKYRFTR
jgi:alpha-L-rhamnosidase